LRPRHLRPRSFENCSFETTSTWDFSFETTFIWDHSHLRPHSFETTFIWDHIHWRPIRLRPHSFETIFIWDHIQLWPLSFEKTFIWDHMHLRSHSFYSVLKWSCFDLLCITFFWYTFRFFAGYLKFCKVTIHLKFGKIAPFRVHGWLKLDCRCTHTRVRLKGRGNCPGPLTLRGPTWWQLFVLNKILHWKLWFRSDTRIQIYIPMLQ